MAQCDFLEWKNGWYCMKKDNWIDRSTVNNYCDSGLSYRDCPYYGSSSGGCYLTTACTEMQSLPDDCHELTVLRQFRDGYMKQQEQGPSDIDEYYQMAPLLVDIIDQRKDRETIYMKIYTDVIVPCVELIEAGQNQEAYDRYKAMVLDLKEQYYHA